MLDKIKTADRYFVDSLRPFPMEAVSLFLFRIIGVTNENDWKFGIDRRFGMIYH